MSKDKDTSLMVKSDKYITNKVKKRIGDTLVDIWDYFLGGFSLQVNKRRLDYDYELQKYENELKEKVSRIPEEKLVEPDIQVVAKALEESRYCIDKEELRHMFSTLIQSSLHCDYCKYVHPSDVEIIRQMSPLDAKIFKIVRESEPRPVITISKQSSDGGLIPIYKNCSWIQEFSLEDCCVSFNILSRLGLINIPAIGVYTNDTFYNLVKQNSYFQEAEKRASEQLEHGYSIAYEKHFIELDQFSLSFYNTCVDNDMNND